MTDRDHRTVGAQPDDMLAARAYRGNVRPARDAILFVAAVPGLDYRPVGF